MEFLVLLGCLTATSCPLQGRVIEFKIHATSVANCKSIVAKGIIDHGYKPATFNVRCLPNK